MPDKNIRDIIGNPVLFYPARAARRSSVITDWYCSSDDERILTAAELEGYKRIIRPQELALPTSQHIDCILHGIEMMKKDGAHPDICVVLLANNVTVCSEWITECVTMMVNNPLVTAVVPVYEDNDHHPYRAKAIDNNGMLQMFEKNISGNISTNRQDLPPCYYLSHNFWVLRASNFDNIREGQQPWSFMGNNIMPFIVDESIDIHHEIDLHIAKSWIEEHYSDF